MFMEATAQGYEATFATEVKALADLYKDLNRLGQPGGANSNELVTLTQLLDNVTRQRSQDKKKVGDLRNIIREIAKERDVGKLAAQRPKNIPTEQEHQQALAQLHSARMQDIKFTSTEQRKLNKIQSELESKKDLLKAGEDEGDGWDLEEINSQALRLALYREFGFTPVQEGAGGELDENKLIVTSRKSSRVETIEFDSKNPNFFYSNLLWESLDL